MTPAISIIVPVYNKAEDLKKSIPALLAQPFGNFEIVCVNDGSADGSASVLADLAARDGRVKIVTQENKGTSVARKTGVLASQGEYVMFLDPDDGFAPDACGQAYRAAKSADADILQFGTDIHFISDLPDSLKKQICGFFTPQQGTFDGSGTILNACFPDVEHVRSYNLCMRIFRGDLCRKAFAEVADERILIGEDGYAFILCAFFAQRAVSIPDRLYIYNLGGGVSGTARTLAHVKRCCGDARKVHAALLDFADRHPDGAAGIRRCAETFREFLIKPFLFEPPESFGTEEEQHEAAAELLGMLPPERWIEILSKERTAREADLKRAWDQADLLQEKYDAIRNSTVWRMSLPLRKIADFMKGRRN